jgi:hypothetical protein
MSGLSFVTLLAYDYRYAFSAIRSYYEIADEIILGLDRDRLTWMRQPFDIDMNEVADFISQVDQKNKIRIFAADFHSNDHPMINETMERNALSLQCSESNWIIQIDSDEILMNAPEFRQWLLPARPDCRYAATWINVFKSFDDKVLLIDPPTGLTPVATKLRGQYASARVTQQPVIVSPLTLLHFCYGRTPEDLLQKLRNWGHARDFDVNAFFEMWQSVSLQNYQSLHNFHPLNGPIWPGLKLATLRFNPWKNPVK